MRNLVVVLLLLTLAGCKLDIAVPAGGSVVSSSGLYECEENETCTLVIDHPWFADEITAVRKPGYFFSHWDGADSGLCSERRSASCRPFDTGFYRDKPDLLDWLVFDASFELRPVFIQTGAPTTESPLWRIESEHRVINYPVEGERAEALLESLQSESNPLDISASTGNRPIGFSTSYVSSQYTQGESTQDNCDISGGVLSIIYETTLPQLIESSGQSAALQDNWSRFQADVQTHEAGHGAINREHFQQLLAEYEALGPLSCDELDEQLDALFQARREIIVQAHDQYHLDVGSSTSFSDYFPD